MRLFRRKNSLTGEKVELRQHERKNYELYADWYGDQEIWHLTSWSSSPMSRSAVERLFDQREKSNAHHSFAIHPKGEDEPIGTISLMNVSEANGSADLSIIVGDPADRDRGYGADAINTILRYGFEDLNLNRIGLSVFEFNEPAIATYEKLGFKKEGRMRDAIQRGDTFCDAVLMSVLREEWESKSS